MSVESDVIRIATIILGIVERSLEEKTKAAALRRARFESTKAAQRILVEAGGNATLRAKARV